MFSGKQVLAKPDTGPVWWGEANDEPAREDARTTLAPPKNQTDPLPEAASRTGLRLAVLRRGAQDRQSTGKMLDFLETGD